MNFEMTVLSSPCLHIQLLFLLMDFGGNIRGLVGWVQITDLCPLLLLDSAWTPEDLRRRFLGSFLSINITLWADWSCPVLSGQCGLLNRFWNTPGSTIIPHCWLPKVTIFPKLPNEAWDNARGCLLFEGLSQQARFPHLQCWVCSNVWASSDSLYSELPGSRPVLACSCLFPWM